MTIERHEPPFVLDERPMLEAWLEYHRATLEWKCDGLSVEHLRERPVPPSTMSLIGLVRHMAEVERNWFRRTLAGEEAPPLYCSKEDPDGDFDNVDNADVHEAFTTWRAECDAARTLAAQHGLDDLAARADEGISLRWILVHMIEEYARHNGHADLFRSGSTGPSATRCRRGTRRSSVDVHARDRPGDDETLDL